MKYFRDMKKIILVEHTFVRLVVAIAKIMDDPLTDNVHKHWLDGGQVTYVDCSLKLPRTTQSFRTLSTHIVIGGETLACECHEGVENAGIHSPTIIDIMVYRIETCW